MLRKYKSDYEKIAMGFLSFSPDLKEMNHLMTELKLYQEEPSHQLFLWENDSGDFAGIIGVEVGEDFVVVRHLTLSPSEPISASQNEMLTQLAKLFEPKKIMGSIETAPLIAAWEKQHKSIGE